MIITYLLIGIVLVLCYESLTDHEDLVEFKFTIIEGFTAIIMWPIFLIIFIYALLRG